jgi:MFS family permease
MVPNFANIARDLGYETGQAAAIASIFGCATLVGRLLVGWLFDRYFAPRVACVVFILAAAGFALAACVTTYGLSWPVLAAAGVLMGLGFGAESDLIGYLVSRYFGYRHFGVIYGSLLGIFILGVAFGPLLYGTVRDMAGSYRPILAVCAVLGVVAGLLMLLLPHFPRTPGLRSLMEHPSADPVFPAARSP